MWLVPHPIPPKNIRYSTRILDYCGAQSFDDPKRGELQLTAPHVCVTCIAQTTTTTTTVVNTADFVIVICFKSSVWSVLHQYCIFIEGGWWLETTKPLDKYANVVVIRPRRSIP